MPQGKSVMTPVPTPGVPPPIPPRSSKGIGGTPAKSGNGSSVKDSPFKAPDSIVSPISPVRTKPPPIPIKKADSVPETQKDENIQTKVKVIRAKNPATKPPPIANRSSSEGAADNKMSQPGIWAIVDKKQSLCSPSTPPAILHPIQQTPPPTSPGRETPPLGFKRAPPSISRVNSGGSDGGKSKTGSTTSLDSLSGWAKVSAKFINKKEMNLGMQRWRSVLSAHMGGGYGL